MAASKGMLLLVQLMLVLVVASISAAKTAPNTIEDLNCIRSCGNVNIPYPFGLESKCYMDEAFAVTCKDSVPKKGTMPLLNVSLEEGEIRVMKKISRTCYNKDGSEENGNFDSAIELNKLSISTTKNKFTAIGCDTVGFNEAIDDKDQTMATGCVSRCSDISQVSDGNCSRIGCCQTSIPKGVGKNVIYLESDNNHSEVRNFNPYGYAFVVEQVAFDFSVSYLSDDWKEQRMPVVLDWAIAKTTCENAQRDLSSYACGENSECINRKDGLGYICNCSMGYHGNPYLSNGCQGMLHLGMATGWIGGGYCYTRLRSPNPFHIPVPDQIPEREFILSSIPASERGSDIQTGNRISESLKKLLIQTQSCSTKNK